MCGAHESFVLSGTTFHTENWCAYKWKCLQIFSIHISFSFLSLSLWLCCVEFVFVYAYACIPVNAPSPLSVHIRRTITREMVNGRITRLLHCLRWLATTVGGTYKHTHDLCTPFAFTQTHHVTFSFVPLHCRSHFLTSCTPLDRYAERHCTRILSWHRVVRHPTLSSSSLSSSLSSSSSKYSDLVCSSIIYCFLCVFTSTKCQSSREWILVRPGSLAAPLHRRNASAYGPSSDLWFASAWVVGTAKHASLLSHHELMCCRLLSLFLLPRTHFAGP